MTASNFHQRPSFEETFDLSRVIGVPVEAQGEKVGTVDDLVVVDRDRFAEVTHVGVARPFGRTTLVVPWEKVATFRADRVILAPADVETWAGPYPPGAVLLKDHILDKKVLDQKDRELEVVYDVGLGLSGGRLLAVDVDLSQAALARRLGLGLLARLFHEGREGRGAARVAWKWVEPLPENLGSFTGSVKLMVVKEELAKLPPVDLADVLEGLGHEQRVAIFGALDTAQASDTLEELDPKTQRDLIASLDRNKVAQLINEMTPGQAADLLSALPWPDATGLVDLLADPDKATKVRAILERQDERVIDYSTSGFLRFAPEKIVARARLEFREAARGKAELTYIYVIDAEDRLRGVVDSKALLLADDGVHLHEIMSKNVVTVKPGSTLKAASELFARYLFRALPVVDEHGKILGVLPYRDVVALRHRFLD